MKTEQGADVQCRDRLMRFDHDRYLCALLAPADSRRHLVAVAAFSLELALIPESVNDPTLGRMRLRYWHDALTILAQREASASQPPVLMALGKMLAETGLSIDHLMVMIENREWDLTSDPPETLVALEEYVAGTAGQLAYLWAKLLGAEESDCQRARSAGIAYGLVGIVRSLPYRERAGHGFVPAMSLRHHGVKDWRRPSPQLAGALEEVLNRALAILAKVNVAPKTGGRAAWLHGALAQLYCRQLGRANFDPWAIGPMGPGLHRYTALMRAQWTGRFG